MQALRMYPQGPRFEDVPTPEPGPGQILIKVAGSGVCHSDLHVFSWAKDGALPWNKPFTLGHEISGWIQSMGSGVRGFEKGEAVVVYSCWGCGQCRSCLVSAENYCEAQRELRGCGLGEDGGMAPYVLISQSRYVVKLGDLEPRDAAPLVDAGLTAYHAVARSLSLLTPSSTALVIGVGGLGHMGVQVLNALTSCRIIAIDTQPDKVALAKSLGADSAFVSDDNVKKNFFEASHGTKADIVIDFAGAQATMDLARKLVRPNGDVNIAGLAGGNLPVGQDKIAWGARVSMSFYGSIADLREVISLAQRGYLKAHTTRFSLDDAMKAYESLEHGALKGRAVICPNG